MGNKNTGPLLDSEVPAGFIQTAKPSKQVRQRRDRSRQIVSGLVVLFVLFTFLNVAMAVINYRSANGLRASVAQDSSPSFKSRYDILGAQVVESWITGDQPVVDTLRGITWPVVAEGQTTGIGVISVGYLGGRTLPLEGSNDFHESLSYSVVATDGSQYTASIDMGVVANDDGEGVRPVLLSAPLVVPRASVAVVAGAGSPVWDAFLVSDESPMDRQVSQWVQAWTSNDAESLKTLTGDSSSSSYSGLVSDEQWQVVAGSVSVVWAVVRPEDGLVAARVVWDITTAIPEGSVDPEASADEQGEVVVPPKLIRQSADLLVVDAGTGLPQVVAWGPPGTYGLLETYQNASGEE